MAEAAAAEPQSLDEFLVTPEEFITRTRTGEMAEFQVAPMTIGQLARFMRIGKPLIETVSRDTDKGLEDLEILDLVAEHGELILQLCAECTGVDPKTVEALEMDDFLVLAAKVIEANVDFFTRRVMPRARVAMEGLRKAAAGATSSSD